MNRQRYARPKPAANNHHKAGGGPGRPFVGRGILEPLGQQIVKVVDMRGDGRGIVGSQARGRPARWRDDARGPR